MASATQPTNQSNPPLSLPPTIPLLEHLLATPPADSLTILTGVLDATTNWVIARLLVELVRPPADPANHTEDESAVVFASFLRDWAFWADLSRRVGLDLPRLRATKQLVFVDGLTRFFSHHMWGEAAGAENRTLGWKGSAAQVVVDLEAIVKEVARGGESVGFGRKRKVVVVLDALDFVLAAGGDEPHAPLDLLEALLGLREHVHSATIALHAATPFLVPSQAGSAPLGDSSPLEVSAAMLLASLAGQARAVLSLRPLPSGVAPDASGFLRVTRGGGVGDGDEDKGGVMEEMEALFFVARDSKVQIFKRPGIVG
ncbi:MAG: hypothetical protein M1829_005541 [Trizodia sp. TS-e1964]|nr:MAG: hypothetical protein M1829_005541 [Trizodia sp. TS-e1964]